MSQDQLDRIRGDLESMRAAAGLDLPFGRDDIRTNLWVAACGAMLAAWSALTPWEHRQVIAVPLTLAVLGALWSARQAHRNRAARPSPWREHRLGIIVTLVLLPLVALYMQWEKWTGLQSERVGAAAVFFVGVAALIVSITDRRRISYIAAAISLMAYGVAIPYLGKGQVVAAGGICITLACLAGALIQSIQLRHAEGSDDPH